ncbi:polysaccharide biosynthesis C-terminal domain-containing protein [Listeria booriae]|uniref:polysaccharide biosynthesis C-terminal domain-containing protein n=1 Tax=Listeria booriae TaxID=1552123 RepID=UPI00163D548D|nr:polysaccharide biosynthesis C-terminal domain-containing protein [Listeria booriae]MBC1308667.1 oligosaccharide flippase family protein [Listeria booriae]
MIKALRNIAKNAYGITIIKKGIVIITGLLTMILLTRFLGPELKGEYSYLFNLVTIGTTILNLGISLVYPEYKRKGRDYRNVFITLSLLQFIIYIALSLLFFFLSGMGNYGFVAILISVSILNLQLSQLNLVEDIRSHSVITIIGAVSNLLFTIVLFYFFSSNVSLVLLVFLLKNVILIGCTLRVLAKNFHFGGSKKAFQAILVAGMLPMLTTFLISINYRIDIVLLGWMNVSFYDIGLYSTGVQLAEYAWMIPDIFKEVMLHKNARRDDIRSLLFSLRMATTSVIFFGVLMIIGGKWLIGFMFGASFIGAYSITVLMFLAVPAMVYTKIIGTLFIANGKWRFYFVTLLITVLLNIALNFALVPFFGTIGSALASIVSYSLSGGIFLIWLIRNTDAKWHDALFIKKQDVVQIRQIIKR